MAIFTTLITATKLLVKNMAKKKLKEKAKKFVTGDKDKKKKLSKQGKKIEKRETFLQSQQRKVKEMQVEPLNASKLMNTDAVKGTKTKPKSGKIDFKALTEKVDNIVGMTDALVFLTGAQSDQEKEKLKLLRQQREKQKKKKKEAKLEKGAGMGMMGNIGKGIKETAQGPLDRMIKFLTNIVIGSLAVFLINNGKKIQKFFQVLGENLELFSKILRVSIFGFQQAMVLANKGLKIAGQGLSKVLSPIGKTLQTIGSKISGALGSLASKFLQVIQKIPGVGQLTNLIKGARQGIDAARTTLSTARAGIQSGITKTFNKVTGNVFRRGLAKAPSRIITKLFGPNAAKMIAKSGKLFKTLSKGAKAIKIPVLGPIIVAVTSILSGDPLGKTLFRTLGAVFGGMIGGALGAALGGIGAPFGMLLGEIVGEFIGSFMYDLFNGDESGAKGVNFLKKKFGEIISGVGKAGKAVVNFALSLLGNVGNFFKDGFSRFITNFPTVDIPEGGGRQTVGGKIAKFLGVKEESRYIEDGRLVKVPNLALLTPFGAPFLLPHLKESFFPSKDKEGGGDPDSLVTTVDEGGEETTAVVETPDNSDTIIDDSKSSSGATTAQLTESSTSSASSSVTAVSSQASYEKSSAGTVILEKPKRSDFGGGRSGAKRYQQAMIMYNDSKAMLNSYYKAQVRASLYKI